MEPLQVVGTGDTLLWDYSDSFTNHFSVSSEQLTMNFPLPGAHPRWIDSGAMAEHGLIGMTRKFISIHALPAKHDPDQMWDAITRTCSFHPFPK